MKKKNEFSRTAHTRGGPRAPTHGETARGGETPRVLMFLQNRRRTSPELQLSTNTIFSSLRTSHLTPWPFSNSLACTPSDPVHGGATSGGIERLHRPPRTLRGPT